MATLYDLKPGFQALLRPTAGRLVRAGLTANAVTLAALALSAAEGAALALQPAASWPFFVLPLVLLVRMALNALDGLMAREHGQASRLGAVLNEAGDMAADLALYLPFALAPGVEPGLAVAAAAGAVATELAGLAAQSAGGARRYDGPMGKSDRALVYGAVALALGFGTPAHPWLNVVLAAILLLELATVIRRVRRAGPEARP
ncbi:MAG TPA: CDP-alcohol phosphatidyltransferase family protein [Alphaproteobacteria bacterium]|nr:CDP-alcohol phosphatidyltransferase family protein [Alphaproteobacteria bacterium]